MSWEALKPVARSTGRPMVTARLSVLKGERVTLALFLSDFVVQAMGGEAASAVDVDTGTDDDAGKMRLRFGPDGAFPVKRSAKAWRVTLPGDGFGERSSNTDPAPILAQDDAAHQLVIELPLADWARTPSPSPARSAPASAPAADGGGASAGRGDPDALADQSAERRRLSARPGPQGRCAGRQPAAGRWRRPDARGRAEPDQQAPRQRRADALGARRNRDRVRAG